MPMVNLGGTSQAVKAGDHYSNYTEFLRQGGVGLDTALTYTDDINHQVAAAIKKFPANVWVTTKIPCCPGNNNSQCITPEYNGTVEESMAKNNALLELNTTNITLLHEPCDTVEHTIQRWLEMEAALKKGLTQAIGVSNFGHDLLKAMAADSRVTVTPAVNQCNHAIANHNESHSASMGGDDATVKYCQEHGIVYSAYSPFEGLSGEDVFKLPEVVAVAKAHNVSGAQVALKWLVQQNITVVTAAHKPSYISEDLDLWSFGDLTTQEMQTLGNIGNANAKQIVV